jgi:hypothetical protein
MSDSSDSSFSSSSDDGDYEDPIIFLPDEVEYSHSFRRRTVEVSGEVLSVDADTTSVLASYDFNSKDEFFSYINLRNSAWKCQNPEDLFECHIKALACRHLYVNNSALFPNPFSSDTTPLLPRKGYEQLWEQFERNRGTKFLNPRSVASNEHFKLRKCSMTLNTDHDFIENWKYETTAKVEVDWELFVPAHLAAEIQPFGKLPMPTLAGSSWPVKVEVELADIPICISKYADCWIDFAGAISRLL